MTETIDIAPSSALRDLLVIGVDPGKTCGFATFSAGVFDFSDDLTFNAALDRLHELTSHGQGLRVIISVERFTPRGGRQHMTAQTHALEFIGAARYIARVRNVLRFLTPGPAEAQHVGSPDVLRQLGWWAPGYDHRNKAAAQVAYAIHNTLPDAYAELLGV